MKKYFVISLFAVGILFLSTGRAFAPLVTTTADQQQAGSGSQDSNIVDLSNKNTDAPVDSPSFENQPPEEKAPAANQDEEEEEEK